MRPIKLKFKDLVSNIIKGNEVYVKNQQAKISITFFDVDTEEYISFTEDDPMVEEYCNDSYVINPEIAFELEIVEELGPKPHKRTKKFIHEKDTIDNAIKWAAEIILAELGCESIFQFLEKDKQGLANFSICECITLPDSDCRMIGEHIGSFREIKHSNPDHIIG